MQCPYCGVENIDGADTCAECEASLAVFDPQTNEVARSVANHPVAVLGPRQPLCVSPDDTVRKVIGTLVQRGVGCVLVVENGTLAGIFTERDVLTRVAGNAARLDQPVRSVMTPKPVTITANDSIGYALQAMDLGGNRHLPVVDASGRPTGMISVRDILRFIGVAYAKSRT